MKIYTLKNCDRCRSATKWLKQQGLVFEEFPIREITPPLSALQQARSQGLTMRNLFNTSGQDYRQLNLKDQLAEMSEEQALELLISHGNLIKRPFLIADDQVYVGFQEELWEACLSPKARE